MPNDITDSAMLAFYAGLAPALAHSLHKQADRIRERAKKTIAAIIEIGTDCSLSPTTT
jgi:hypothetical protein